MKSLVLALAVLIAAGAADARPPRKKKPAPKVFSFRITELGEVGDGVAISSKGVVAVGFRKKPGYLRAPGGKKTPLPEGFVPFAVNGKGDVGGQMAGRAALLAHGTLQTLSPSALTKVSGLADDGTFLLGEGRKENDGSISWLFALMREKTLLPDDAVALADDGGYVTRDALSPEWVRGERRTKLPGLAGQDWTRAVGVASGGLACGFTESGGPGYVNAVWWDAAGKLHRLDAPGHRGGDSSRTWLGARAERINARSDVLGAASEESKWPVGVKDFFCRRASDLTVFWPGGGLSHRAGARAPDICPCRGPRRRRDDSRCVAPQ